MSTFSYLGNISFFSYCPQLYINKRYLTIAQLYLNGTCDGYHTVTCKCSLDIKQVVFSLHWLPWIFSSVVVKFRLFLAYELSLAL
jgi:hypothetical protein